jgi:hypothetical protein
MRRELRSEIEIDATAAEVWAVLTDTQAYSEWNGFMPRLNGDLRAGARLDVRIEPPNARGMRFRPTVLRADAGRELRWLGRFILPGLFDGEHSFRVEPLPGGRTRFVQSERFTGLLVGAFGRTLDKTELGFAEMNASLKARVESSVAAA